MERFFTSGETHRLPADLRIRALARLQQINMANSTADLRLPTSNRLERLRGKRRGQWSIRINKQWRVCFRFEGGDAFDVEIADYH